MSDEFWHDSIFHDARDILTKEEYDSDVIFAKNLFSILETENSPDENAIWYCLTDEEIGFIQQGRPGTKSKYDLIPIKHGKNVNDKIVIRYGDLLTQLYTEHRIKWKSFFESTNCPINIAKTILFPESKKDFEICAIYWNKRRADHNDFVDLPWLTPGDHDQIEKDLQYLKHTWDSNLKMTKDMSVMKFNVAVLEKYHTHMHCKLNISDRNFCSISFLNYNGDSVTSTNFFFRTDIMLMMYAKDFVLIPPKEREYWTKFQILD